MMTGFDGEKKSSELAEMLLSCLLSNLDLQDLWQMIVGLSYLGDVRMGLAEDSKKVERIATSSSQGLQEAYRPLLEVTSHALSCHKSS